MARPLYLGHSASCSKDRGKVLLLWGLLVLALVLLVLLVRRREHHVGALVVEAVDQRVHLHDVLVLVQRDVPRAELTCGPTFAAMPPDEQGTPQNRCRMVKRRGKKRRKVSAGMNTSRINRRARTVHIKPKPKVTFGDVLNGVGAWRHACWYRTHPSAYQSAYQSA